MEADKVVVEVSVRPKAGRDRVGPVRAGRLVVELRAPAEQGKANEALIRLLAKALSVSRRDVSILKGATARRKTIRVDGRFSARDLDRLVGSGG